MEEVTWMYQGTQTMPLCTQKPISPAKGLSTTQLLKTESHQTLLLEPHAAETTVPCSKALLEACFPFPNVASKQPPSLPEGVNQVEEGA